MKHFRQFMLVGTIGASLSLNALTTYAIENHKAHVHGVAKLTLAMENSTHAEIDLDVPGDSIFGFEHKATSSADKKSQAAGFSKLREQAQSVIQFDPSLGCAVSVKKVEIEKEESGSGEHSDVNASYSVECKKPLSGTKLTMGLIRLFPKIKNVSLQILSSIGQTQKTVHDSSEIITLPDESI